MVRTRPGRRCASAADRVAAAKSAVPPLLLGKLEEYAAERSFSGAVLDEHSRTRVDESSLLDQLLDTLLPEPTRDPLQRRAQPSVVPVLPEAVAQQADEISGVFAGVQVTPKMSLSRTRCMQPINDRVRQQGHAAAGCIGGVCRPTFGRTASQGAVVDGPQKTTLSLPLGVLLVPSNGAVSRYTK